MKRISLIGKNYWLIGMACAKCERYRLHIVSTEFTWRGLWKYWWSFGLYDPFDFFVLVKNKEILQDYWRVTRFWRNVKFLYFECKWCGTEYSFSGHEDWMEI